MVSRRGALAKVEKSAEDELDAVFSALSHRTRRGILSRLATGPAPVGELAAPFAMTLPAVSKHLRILERARLLRRERDGWYHRCHIVGEPLETAREFLDRYRPFWEDTLSALARHVEDPPHDRPRGRKRRAARR